MNVSGDILFYAFRYALGRSTYAVDDVVTDVIRNTDELSATTKSRIKKEIDVAIEKGHAGMKCDVDNWMKLRDHLENIA